MEQEGGERGKERSEDTGAGRNQPATKARREEGPGGLQASEMMEWSRRRREQWCPTHGVTCILKAMWLVATWTSFPGIFAHCLRKGRGGGKCQGGGERRIAKVAEANW